MTTTNDALVDFKYVEDSITTQYTSTNVTTLIDYCAVTNQTGLAQTVSIYLVPSGGSASAVNRPIVTKALQAGETYLCPEVRNWTMNNGDFIAAIASAASSITLGIAGRKVT